MVLQIAQPQLCTKNLPEKQVQAIKTDRRNSQKVFRGQYCRQRCVWVPHYTASSSSPCALSFQLHAGREEESSSAESFYDLKQGYTIISNTIFKLHQIH